MRSALNRMAVIPSWTPRSLRAFCVQLKLGEYAMASSINVKAMIGAVKPIAPDVFSQFIPTPATRRTLKQTIKPLFKMLRVHTRCKMFIRVGLKSASVHEYVDCSNFRCSLWTLV